MFSPQPDVPPVLTSRLLRDAGFAHGFSTRVGGGSPPPFDNFDFATARNLDTLVQNQRRLAEHVGFDVARLYQATQVHGAAVADAGGTLDQKADALFAGSGSRAAVAIRVADCVPILLGAANGSVAAVHAGWRGLVGGVIEAAIARFDVGPTVAAVGPCIGPCCFEVGAEVAAQIGAVDRVVGEKAFCDLRAAARARLVAGGVREIDDVGGCTKCDAVRFYSHRRDGESSGRLIAVIVAR